MTVTTSQIGQSPFEPITDFRQFATDPTARVRLKDIPMSEPFDLVAAIKASRQTADAMVSVRAAAICGGEVIPMLADAQVRFEEQQQAMAGMLAYIEADLARANDDAAMAAVEGEGVRDAAE